MPTPTTIRSASTAPLPHAGALAAALALASALVLAAPAAVQAEAVPAATCLECHADLGAALARTAHGRLAEHQQLGEGRDCEACHGPGEAHAASGDPALIRSLVADQGAEADAVCRQCHQAGAAWDWELSHHAEADVSCLSCHAIHNQGGAPALLTAAEPELCFGCHAEQRGKFQLPSHHPVREGFLACTGCHDPHGERLAGLRVGETARDLCLSCHTQHQGPFIFEHSPVQEDCALCHDVHGTVANNLLRQNEPFLCLNCHQPHFHSGLMAVEGAFAPGANDPVGPVGGWPGGSGPATDNPAYAGLSGVSHPDGWKATMLTKCTQCHQAIHGTDLPSQSISGQGRALQR